MVDPETDPDPKLSASFNAENYSLTTSTYALKATITRTDGETLTDEDKADWTIVDPSGVIVQSGNTTITSKGVATLTATRNNPINLNSGSSTIKLMHGGATYATTIVNYSPSASILTDNSNKLTTDGPENVTAVRINGVEIDINDYNITSNDISMATLTTGENGLIVTPLKGGQAIFTITTKTAPIKSVEAKITFYEPVAKVGDNYYKTLSAAFKGAASGDTILMQSDAVEAVSFSGNTPRVQDFEVTLDLSGHNLTAPTSSSYALRVDYGTVTIIDSQGAGSINYGKDYAIMVSHLAGDYPSKLIIEGGNYIGKTSVIQAGLPGGNGANYKYYGGDVVIKGGTFTAVPDTDETYDEQGNFKYALNLLDMNASSYAGGIYSPSSISVEGGRFYKFDPANNVAEGANTNFVADGFTSTKDGDWYVVNPA